MKTAFIIAVGVGLGLVLVKVVEQLVVEPVMGSFLTPGTPKGPADLPLEDRKAAQTERL